MSKKELELTEGKQQKEPKGRWSDCGQVFFCDGKTYGLTDTLHTICLGKEDDIKKSFETGELNNKLAPIQQQVLAGILDYRKEEGYGTATTRAGDMERASNNGTSRHKPKATRSLTFRKRFPLRKVR